MPFVCSLLCVGLQTWVSGASSSHTPRSRMHKRREGPVSRTPGAPSAVIGRQEAVEHVYVQRRKGNKATFRCELVSPPQLLLSTRTSAVRGPCTEDRRESGKSYSILAASETAFCRIMVSHECKSQKLDAQQKFGKGVGGLLVEILAFPRAS